MGLSGLEGWEGFTVSLPLLSLHFRPFCAFKHNISYVLLSNVC